MPRTHKPPRVRTYSTKYKYYVPNLATPEEKKAASAAVDQGDTMAELRKAWGKP